jgi:hypothetical protein
LLYKVAYIAGHEFALAQVGMEVVRKGEKHFEILL